MKLNLRAALASLLLWTYLSGCDAQIGSLSMAVAHNDKIQKSMVPNILAISEKFGANFRTVHGPYQDRRIVCKWAGEWADCGYFRLSKGSLLTVEERNLLTTVLHNPCVFISFDSLKALPPNRPDGQASFEIRQAYGKWENLRRLSDACKSGFFENTGVQIAHPRKGKDGKLEPDLSNDEIGFEMRMRVTK